MNLGFLYYHANLGGVTSVIRSRMPALLDAGWKVHAFFSNDVGGVDALHHAGLASVQIVHDLAAQPSGVLKKENFDILTVVDMPETIARLRESFSGPMIYEIHTPIDKVLLRTTSQDLEQVDRVIVPSKWSQNWVREKIPGPWDHEKVGIVPNIIDRTLFYPPTGATPTASRPSIAWVGKIAAYKRWRDAVRILGTVRQSIECDIIFITGGESNERNTQDFLTELATCGLFGHCAWYYNLPGDEMANVYRDCFTTGGMVLSTSEAESFCLVAHEAMSCGVPVAAARAGALEEIYPEPLGQLLFEVGEINQGAKIITELLKNQAQWIRMSAVGLQEQKKYEAGTLRQAYLKELQQTIRIPAAL